jgi:ElaB/YqjD/DUF883 family membrane-anchored ribosome-binding protein
MSSTSPTGPAGNGPKDEATVTSKARQFTHEAIDAAAEKAESLERKLREESGRLSEKAGATGHDVSKQMEETLTDVEAYIRKEPVKAAGIAFAAGVVAMLLLRR